MMSARFICHTILVICLLGVSACSQNTDKKQQKTDVASNTVVEDSGSQSGNDQDEKAIAIEQTSVASQFDQGNKWAILVGVNNYLDPKIKSLKYCVADARLMEKALIENGGYEKKRILVISDDQQREERKPFLINLQEQVRERLFLAKPGDTVLVFFSGHGFLGENGEGYLAPKNCRRNSLALSAFPTNELRGMLDNCAASQKLLILDCCNAGAKGEGDSSSQEVGQAFAKAKGLITLASCMQNEVSEEWDKKKQGLFTYFLAEGLAGKADKDRNGIIDSDEIYRYVSDEVPLAPQEIENELQGAKPQHPVRMIGPDVVGVFGLARVSLRPEMVLESNEASLRFTVRNSSSQADIKPVVADAVVELMYRSSKKVKPQVLAKGTSDKRGHVALKAELTAVQQVRGDFLALVTRGEESKLWRLTNFNRRGNWDLTIPLPNKLSLLIAPYSQDGASAKQGVWAKHLNRSVIETNKQGMKIVLIPPGEFMMGSPISEEGRDDDELQHTVQITKPFYLGMYEVTQGEYEQLNKKLNNPSTGGGGGGFFSLLRREKDHQSWNQGDMFFHKLSELNSLARLYFGGYEMAQGGPPPEPRKKIPNNNESVEERIKRLTKETKELERQFKNGKLSESEALNKGLEIMKELMKLQELKNKNTSPGKERGRSEFSVIEESQLPVASVSWYDCIYFCNKLSERELLSTYYDISSIDRMDGSIIDAEVKVLGGNGYRLPTEAEWEYACRAGTTTPYYFGSVSNGQKSNVDGEEPYGTETEGTFLGRTTLVGKYAPNRFGLYDMHGNAGEWTGDWYDEDYYRQLHDSIAKDPRGTNSKSTKHVRRGGSFGSSAQQSRSSFRSSKTSSKPSEFTGFRIARTP